MSHKSYSCSDGNESIVYSKLNLYLPDEHQINKWNYQTVPEAVINGSKLRKAKLKTRNVQAEINVSDFSYNDNCNYYKPRFVSGFKKHKLAKSNQWFPKSQSVQQKSKPVCPKHRSSSKSSRKCPLRVVELAEPDKRHCIETWRKKFDVLPGIMIDRLKQHVMDELPIVTIPEALNTFKRKRSGTTDNTKNCLRTRKKLGASGVQKYKYLNKVKEWSALFGRKIAIKLEAPLNVTLNAHFQKIANVIASDIELIMRKNVDMTKNKNKIVLQEVSGKVAIWIASIIEESSFKILEEELQDLEEEVGPVFEILDILLHNTIDISETNYRSKCELEKQSSDINQKTSENNQFDISTPEKTYTSEYDTGESNMTINESLDINVLDQDAEKRSTSLTESETSLAKHIKPDDIKTAMEKDLENIIRNILDNENNDYMNKEVYENTVSNQESLDKNVLITSNTHIDSDSMTPMSEYLNKIIFEEIDENINALSPLEDTNINEADLATPQISEERSSNEDLKSNVSATFASIEEDPDDQNKKVKFSRNSMIDPAVTIKNQLAEPNNQTENHDQDNKLFSHQQFPNLPQNTITYFEKPLSTDEHWPEDLQSSPVKIIENISKSVTSLGKIYEYEESEAESPVLQHDQLNTNHLQEKINKYISQSDEFNNNKKSCEVKDEKNNAFIDEAMHTDLDSENKLSDIKEGRSNREELPGKTNIENTTSFKFKSEHSTDGTLQVGEGDQVNIDEKNNNIHKTVIQTLTPFETKFDYKIYPNTAPSWVKGDSGQMSVTSLQANKIARKQINDNDIRQWCKNMEYITENLEMWTNWINNKCHNISSLKLSTDRTRTCGDAKRKTYEWMNIKNNIDDDIVFWTKLRRRHEKRLKYNYLPKIVSTEYAFRCNCKNKN